MTTPESLDFTGFEKIENTGHMHHKNFLKPHKFVILKRQRRIHRSFVAFCHFRMTRWMFSVTNRKHSERKA